MSESHKGQISWMKGKYHTEETKDKLSVAAKKRYSNPEFRKKINEIYTNIDLAGIKNPMYGRHHSEEAKQKMSIARKRWHKLRLEEVG